MSTLSHLLQPGESDELVGLGLGTVDVKELGTEPYPKPGDYYKRKGLVLKAKRHTSIVRVTYCIRHLIQALSLSHNHCEEVMVH